MKKNKSIGYYVYKDLINLSLFIALVIFVKDTYKSIDVALEKKVEKEKSIVMFLQKDQSQLNNFLLLRSVELVQNYLEGLENQYPEAVFCLSWEGGLPPVELNKLICSDTLEHRFTLIDDLDFKVKLLYQINVSFFIIVINSVLSETVLSFILYIIVFVAFLRLRFRRLITEPLYFAVNKLQNLTGSDGSKGERVRPSFQIEEWDFILEKIDLFYSKLKHLNDVESNEKLVVLAKQVAHDIRSPLAALDMALKDDSNFPEEKRMIISIACNRIHEISNQLLDRGKRINNEGDQQRRLHLSSVVESIISEKRMEFRRVENIDIKCILNGESYGIFANIVPREFKRILSNLINNSIEALKGEQGVVEVTIERVSQDIVVIVSDNGIGIPEKFIKNLGHKGASFGKGSDTLSGSGLGLYHARTTVESWGGSLVIESQESIGTRVKIIPFMLNNFGPRP